MTLPRYFRHWTSALTSIWAFSFCLPASASVTLDGSALAGEGYATDHIQAHASGTTQSALANLRSRQIGDRLHLFMAGRATDQAIILFIDAKPGGSNRITPNLISSQPGGEEVYINRLASSSTVGMTFETGFEPELAIRIYGNETSGTKVAHVNRYDFLTGGHAYVGESHAAVVANGPIRGASTDWRPVNTAYSSIIYGVEMALNLSELGVSGGSQVVKVQAILVAADSLSANNQSLGSLGTSQAMGNGNPTIVDFNTEAGTQTISINVTGLNPMADQDGDGLLNGVETGTGIFVSSSNTGTDPYIADSDGDGFNDGPEVAGSSSLGFVSNPTIANYANMAVPGSFNLPVQWQPNSSSNNPSTAMTRESNTLTGQYRWALDYRFVASQRGNINFKFTSGGTFDNQWGLADAPGTVRRNGSNVPDKVPATGFHRFEFDQLALTYSFGRVTYPDATAFLAAYGLSGSPTGDADMDGVLNQDEFIKNTDPTNPDSDGDNKNDLVDPQPLLVTGRDVVFRVDMNVQAINGSFSPGDPVKLVVSSPYFELPLQDSGGFIYTGTIEDVQGNAGELFGEYNFSSGIDVELLNRNFTLQDPAAGPQILPIVFYNDESGTDAYTDWAVSFPSNPGAPGANPDNDPFSNLEEFLFGTSPLESTASLTSMEQSAGTITIRWLQRSDPIYRFQQSTTLAPGSWSVATEVPVNSGDQAGVPVNYTRKEVIIPTTGAPRRFFRVTGKE